jgi:hypothetical protein
MQLADGEKNYSGKAFFRYNDPREPVIFPALTGIQKMQVQEASGVDP